MNSTEEIWLEYHRNLSNFLRNRVPENVADDLLQDVFERIHTKLSTLKDDIRLQSWLYQITRNVIADYYRSHRQTEELPDSTMQLLQNSDDQNDQELSSCLAPMIAQLPDKYRVALQLSELERKTQQEVADLEGISLSGAKSRVQRGRALLKVMLHNCCEIELNNNNQPSSVTQKDEDCKYC